MGEGKEANKKVALFFNALVLPGTGHIMIGQRVKGALLAVASLFFLILPIFKLFTVMTFALNTMAVKTENPMLDLITALKIAWPLASKIVYHSLIAIIIIWSYGVFDIARGLKQQANTP